MSRHGDDHWLEKWLDAMSKPERREELDKIFVLTQAVVDGLVADHEAWVAKEPERKARVMKAWFEKIKQAADTEEAR